jgi:hypothetical protein
MLNIYTCIVKFFKKFVLVTEYNIVDLTFFRSKRIFILPYVMASCKSTFPRPLFQLFLLTSYQKLYHLIFRRNVFWVVLKFWIMYLRWSSLKFVHLVPEFWIISRKEVKNCQNSFKKNLFQNHKCQN